MLWCQKKLSPRLLAHKFTCNRMTPYLSLFKGGFPSRFGTEFDDYVNKQLMPLSHISEKDGKFVLKIDLPSVKKKDIDITLTKQHIVVKAKLEKTYCISRLNCVQEFEYFNKIIPLPSEVDSKKISAKFSNGILTIIMSKKQKGIRIKIE